MDNSKHEITSLPPLNGLTDSHLHLQAPDFDPDLADVVSRAKSAGITRMICNATCEDDWQKVIHISEQFDGIIPSLGLHPWYASGCKTGWQDRLSQLITTNNTLCGEAGLDSLNPNSPLEVQETVLIDQLTLAMETNTPITLHCVKAWGKLMQILSDYPRFNAGIILHAFSGSAELVKPLLEKNAFFSITGSICNERNKKIRQTVTSIPPDRLLIETDSPDFPLTEIKYTNPAQTINGRLRNEPQILPHILFSLASLLSLDLLELCSKITQNSEKLFSRYDR